MAQAGQKKILFFLCFVLISFYSAAQVEKYAESITPADLKNHLYKIASKEMQGRETATEGQRIAASYIEEQFKQHHLSPGWNGGYQQQFPVYRDSLVKAALTINGNELKNDTDFAVTLNSGFNFSFEANEILFAGFGQSDTSRDDYKNVKANGKIVVIWPGAPTRTVKGKKIKDPVPDYYTLQNAAKKNGAIALIIIQERFPKGPSRQLGRMYVNDYRQDSIPNTFVLSDSLAIIIFGKNLEALKKMMKTNAPVARSIPLQSKT